MQNETINNERLGSDARTQDSNTTQEPVERCLHPSYSALAAIFGNNPEVMEHPLASELNDLMERDKTISPVNGLLAFLDHQNRKCAILDQMYRELFPGRRKA